MVMTSLVYKLFRFLAGLRRKA